MHLIEKALFIALEAHKGQVDKAGKPYILHPLRLMMSLDDEVEMISALLHDVIEDSDTTEEDLMKAGIPVESIEIIGYLTKQAGESYDDFIKRISAHKKASRVKIKDIEDNMTISRLETLGEADLTRLAKYHKSLKFLQSLQFG